MKPVRNPDDGVRRVVDDAMWELLSGILAKLLSKRGAPPALALREFLEAIFFWARTGVPWRDLPACFGEWDAVYARWRRWEGKDRWKKLWRELQALAPQHEATRYADSTVIRAHQHASGGDHAPEQRATGRSRGGVGTKIHVLATDAQTAVAVTITPGQDHDLSAFDDTMAEVPEDVLATAVVADKAFDSDALRADLQAAGFDVTIPPRRGRRQPADYDRTKYKARNQVERLINRLKRLKRLATRYEKLACTYLAVVHLGCILSIIA